jgi:hypothetical protein
VRAEPVGQGCFLDQSIEGAIGYSVRLLTQEDTEHTAINVKPLGARVLVQPLDEKEVKNGGIIIPENYLIMREDDILGVTPAAVFPRPETRLVWEMREVALR